MSNKRALTIELLRQCAVVQENRQTTIVAPNEAIASFLLYRFLELAQIYHHYKCIILTLRGKAIASSGRSAPSLGWILVSNRLSVAGETSVL